MRAQKTGITWSVCCWTTWTIRRLQFGLSGRLRASMEQKWLPGGINKPKDGRTTKSCCVFFIDLIILHFICINKFIQSFNIRQFSSLRHSSYKQPFIIAALTVSDKLHWNIDTFDISCCFLYLVDSKSNLWYSKSQLIISAHSHFVSLLPVFPSFVCASGSSCGWMTTAQPSTSWFCLSVTMKLSSWLSSMDRWRSTQTSLVSYAVNLCPDLIA